MPLRLTACFGAALILLLLAAAGQGAPPASGHWHSVLAAGDIAEPVFDNAIAGFSQWLMARGVPAGDIHRLSASRTPRDATAEPASAPPGKARRPLPGIGKACWRPETLPSRYSTTQLPALANG